MEKAGNRMEYFLMECDKRVERAIKIKAVADFEEDNIIDTTWEEDHPLPDYFRIRKQMKCYDIVSDGMRKLVEIYGDNVVSYPFILTDVDKKEQKPYWYVKIPLKDCLYNNERWKGTAIPDKKDIIIDARKAKENHVFLIQYGKQEYVIASLAFAENVLRKNPYGIWFQPLYVESCGITS